MKLLERAANIVFPSRCIFCDSLVSIGLDECICDNCTENIYKIDDTCIICGMKLLQHKYGNFCASCKTKMSFDYLTACYLHTGKARDSILGLKFSKRIDYARTMGRIMARKLSKDNLEDFIVTAIPISDIRMTERKYNQADLIAHRIAKELGLPFYGNLLIKIKDNLKQSTLNTKERWMNISGAYDVLNKEKIRGAKIILVDDVCTTGATLNEATKTLKRYGAIEVFCITFVAAKVIEKNPMQSF